MTLSTIHFDFDISLLDPVQRLLLTTDGNLTEMLEVATLEPTRLHILSQRIRPADETLDLLTLNPGELVMERQVLLRGERSGKTHMYAESFIAITRLHIEVQRDLLDSSRSFGCLLKRHSIEILRTVLHCSVEPAEELSEFFEGGPETPLVVRTCRVSSGGRPVMLTTEHFEVWT